ncbi:AraC family transcriptional regulator [Paraburkholderia guartelaensis]|uniref:AraC family transcriptional regulator n=1 Tax=Paraburkholderia guartelaensis TaxID=2546446 RepID=UPI002AB79F7B|nr:AraC family transcriptional regulator [Paraburkholderia guartelaensis]
MKEKTNGGDWRGMEQFGMPASSMPGLAYWRSSAKPYTLDYTTTSDTICLVFGHIATQTRYDDEPARPLAFRPETAAFHPRGCRLRVDAMTVSEGFVAFSYVNAIEHGISRNAIAPLRHSGNRENIGVEGIRHLIRYARVRLRGVTQPDPWEMQCLSTLVYVEIEQALSQPVCHRSPKLSNAGFDRLEAYIRDHIGSTITCADLARELDLPLRSVFDAVKARTGRSLYRLVVERRLDAAMHLLRESDMPICEVAAACGFASQQHMTTLFTQRRGMTPRRARADWT